MRLQPYFYFYKTIVLFVLVLGLIGYVAFGFGWGLLLLLTIAVPLCYLAHTTLYKNERFFYANLGITGAKLIGRCYLINMIIGAPLYCAVTLFISFLLGDLSYS